MAGFSTPVSGGDAQAGLRITLTPAWHSVPVERTVQAESVAPSRFVKDLAARALEATEIAQQLADRVARQNQIIQILAAGNILQTALNEPEQDIAPPTPDKKSTPPAEPASAKPSREAILAASRDRRTTVLIQMFEFADEHGRFEHPDVGHLFIETLGMPLGQWSSARTQLSDMGCVSFEKPGPSSRVTTAYTIYPAAVSAAIAAEKLSPEKSEELLGLLEQSTESQTSPVSTRGEAIQDTPIPETPPENGSELAQATNGNGNEKRNQGLPMSARTRRALGLPLNADNGKPVEEGTPTFLGQSHKKRGRKNRVIR